MRISILKGLLAISITTSLFIFLLTACGVLNSAKVISQTLVSDKRTSRSTHGSDMDDLMGKYNPAIDISFVRSVDDDIVTNILTKCPGETIEDNRWIKLYKEQLGINIKYDWTVKGNYESDAYNRKMNVILASGDLPDVVVVNATQLKLLADSDMITDMTPYFNKYASDITKKAFTSDPATLDSATFNGKLMAVPYQDDALESAHYLWIRVDWLKKLGMEPPKTMDDLLEISEAFTTKDPDGNLKADTYGISITKELYSGCMGTEGFFAGYHACPNMWIENSSGKVVYGSIQPEIRTALQKLAGMYKSGQIDEEFAVKDVGKVAETIAAGKVGINFGEQWNPMYPLISNFNNDNDADWTGYPIVSADSRPVKVPLKFRILTYYAVNKGCKHPESLVKMINLYTDINCGVMGENYYNKYFNPVENGNVGVWKFSPVTVNPPLTNFNSYLSVEKARESNDMSVLTYAAGPVMASIEDYLMGDKSQWSWDKIYGSNGVFRVMKVYQSNNALLPDKFTGVPTKTMVEKKAALDKMEKEIFIKIIMGAAPIDEFDKFVDDWNKIGGIDITKEVNAWYEKANTK